MKGKPKTESKEMDKSKQRMGEERGLWGRGFKRKGGNGKKRLIKNGKTWGRVSQVLYYEYLKLTSKIQV